jgi:hypothetical protein
MPKHKVGDHLLVKLSGGRIVEATRCNYSFFVWAARKRLRVISCAVSIKW